MNVAELVGLLAGFTWLAVIAILILVVVRASRNQPVGGFSTLLIGGIVLASVLSVVSAGLVFIEPQERGVVISAVQPKGYREEILQPGLSWVLPFAERVVIYPISKQTYTMSISGDEGFVQGDDSVSARTSDGQEISVDASVIYAIDPNRVIDVHIAWQDRYTEDLVRAQARGIIRDAVSQYGVEQVVSSQRFALVENIRTNLESKLADNGLILVDFVLRNITFSPEYAASVEQKQIAEQLAQQAAFVVEQRRQEAEQARQVAQGQADAAVIAAQGAADARLIEAEAEARALEYIAQVIRENPSLLTYQYINQLTPNIQVMLLPSDSPFVFPLPDLTAPPQ